MRNFSVLVYIKALFLRSFRESVSRETYSNYVKAWTVRRGGGQQREDLRHFQEAAGPYNTIARFYLSHDTIE